ncbi:MAG: hypothetical protein EB121_01890 [Alphaproteobacteria bacterium]|nr:hypothetical protein [Alphaproteobacteria bacterium]
MSTSNMDTVKQAADVVSVIAAIGSWLNMFTPIFGLIGATWTLMRIAEMVTGKPFHELIRRKQSEQSDQEKP